LKRHGNLWDKIIDPDNLYLAYRKARKGKAWQKGILEFEKDVEGNLLKLQKMLCKGEFTTSEYRSKTIYEPKEREIYILPFYPDRITQHALLQVVAPIWDNLMIHDSYACREGKGMHDASRKTMRHVHNYKYCLKCDISKFYPSIDHNILMDIIENKIKCKPTLTLLEDIVRSFGGGKNTPIGNYTSQWFGNLYMNELDNNLKQKHGVKTLIRYCDDFVMFSDSKQELQDLKRHIKRFLKDKLDLTFSKWSIFKVVQGVDFLGYRHFPDKILLRKSTAKRVMKRIKALPKLLMTGEITFDQYKSSIASTKGWLKWANTYNLKLNLKLAGA
jgi:retron-type reverse transcriptase